MLLDALKDIVKHTHSLGFIEMVKVIGTSTDLKIETKDVDNTVIIYGSMYQPVKGIESTLGLSRMGILKGFVSMMPEKTGVSIAREQRNNIDVPVGVKFDGKGFLANYRFMSEAMINEQVKVPPFKGATWDITISPSKTSIDQLSNTYGVLGSFEKRFIVIVNKGELQFQVGSGPTDGVTTTFAENVTGSLKHQWTYPLGQVLSILKLADTSTATMSFSDMGALKIDIDSGIGKYSYILPAGKS
jgi:hypothetical protein